MSNLRDAYATQNTVEDIPELRDQPDAVTCKAGSLELGAPSPVMDQAIRSYAVTGKPATELAKAYNLDVGYLRAYIRSSIGKRIIAEVTGELDHRFQCLYGDVIDTLEQAIKHSDPGVALAGTGQWLKHAKGTKVHVEISAEDVVQKIMSGELDAWDNEEEAS